MELLAIPNMHSKSLNSVDNWESIRNETKNPTSN